MYRNHHHHHDQYNPLNQDNLYHNPSVVVVPNNGYGNYWHHHHRGRVYSGFLLLFIPIIIIGGIFSLLSTAGSIGMAATSLTTAGAAGAGAGAIGLSAATFGIGALILYGVAGLAYMYSSAKECYNSEKNVLDMMKSRIVNEDGASFKGIMKAAGAVLWSPFLLIGGLAGMGVKAIANCCTSKQKKPGNENSVEMISMKESYSKMDTSPSHRATSESSNDQKPIHTKSLYVQSPTVTERSEHLLDSTTSEYPSIARLMQSSTNQ